MYRPTDRDTDRQTKFTDSTYMWGSLRLALINACNGWQDNPHTCPKKAKQLLV